MGFHGYTDHTEYFQQYSGLQPLSEQYGFVAMYPAGIPDEYEPN